MQRSYEAKARPKRQRDQSDDDPPGRGTDRPRQIAGVGPGGNGGAPDPRNRWRAFRRTGFRAVPVGIGATGRWVLPRLGGASSCPGCGATIGQRRADRLCAEAGIELAGAMTLVQGIECL